MTHDPALAEAIPPPLENDDDDVAWALQTAAVQWKRGLYADAIVWLGRAVESAIEIGNSARARDLQQLAAALSAYVPAHSPPDAAPGRLSIEIDFNEPAPPPVARPVPPPPPRRPLPPRPRPPRPGPAAPNPFLTREPVAPAFPRAPAVEEEPTIADASPIQSEELPRFPSSIDEDDDGLEGAEMPSRERLPYEVSDTAELPRFPTPSEEGLPRFPSSDETSVPEPTEPFSEPIAGKAAPSGAYEREPIEPPQSYREYAPQAAPLEEQEGPGRESLPDMIAEAAPLASSLPPVEPVAEPAQAAQLVAPPEPAAPSEETEPRVADVLLADVTGLQDLPPEAQQDLARVARLERLANDEEIGAFAVALVVDGSVALMPTIADVACARAAKGEVVFTHGTLEESIALRVVAGSDGATVAVWDAAAWESATADCPWVADELRLLADRFQALAGASMGALGDRFDESLRASVTNRCQVKALMPEEILVEAGGSVPGMHIVGGGRIELVEGESVVDELGPGDFLFPEQVLSAGTAPCTARAAKSGALVMYSDRMTAHELLVSVPPLIELLAG